MRSKGSSPDSFRPSRKLTLPRLNFPGLKLTLAVASLIAASFSALAHPYASGLTNNAGTISFILNESANDVSVVFNNGAATNDLGALSSGVQSFSLGSYTNYSIIVTRTGTGAISQISVDAPNNDFFGPRGVAVNQNPQSHDFGRIYVVNANAGAGPSRTTTRGLYVLNADTSDALGYGAVAHGTNGITLGSSTTFSPYRVFVAADNQVYVSDASGSPDGGTIGEGSVWMLNPDLNNPTAVFQFGLGGTTNFGPCASTPIVFGDVSTGNMVLYCSLWNYTNLFTGSANYTSIYKYNIGSGPLPWNTIPTNYAVVGLSDSQNANGVGQDMTIAPDGKIYVTQYRNSGSGGNVTLWVYDTNAETLLFNSSLAGGGTDVLSNCYSVAVSPDDNYFAAIRMDGTFFVAQLTNGIPNFATLSTNTTTLGSVARGVAFDAADNMYFASGGADRLRVYSLGLTTKTITANDATVTNGTFQLILPNSNAPAITSQPASQSVLSGLSASFSVSATGLAPLSYQWQFNGTNLADGTQFTGSLTNSLSLASAQTNNAGPYLVIITNSYGSITSSVAHLSVVIPSNQLPIVWTQFANSPGVSTVRHDDIYFTDPTNGWATQNSYIYRTTNGGLTWTTNLNLGGTHFRSIGFATPLIGFAGNLGVGSYDSGVTNTNILYRSIDGGVTWSNVDGFAEAGMQGLCSIQILDSQHIYGGGRVRGTNAFVIISTNGGFNWNIVNLSAQGVMNGIMDIHFMDPTNGWVVGMSTNSYYTPPYYGRIARTSDGGNTWTAAADTTVSNSYFWKMAWPTPTIGYASLQQNASFSNIIFFKTVDGGNTWTSNGISLAGLGLGSSSFYLQGIGFVSTNEGWIGGASGITYADTFLHTVDGGVTWTPAGFNDTYYINRIRFLSPTLGFASGANLYTFSLPLAITTQPQSQVVDAGTNVNLFVAAAGVQPLSYQWLFNGTARPGATTPNLILTNVTRIDAGTYSLIVTNSQAGLQSSNAVIRVLVPERLANPVLLPGGQLQLTFSDADGGNLITSNDLPTFTVLVSTNLFNWSVLTNALSITNGMVLLQDTWTNSPMRYYRINEH